MNIRALIGVLGTLCIINTSHAAEPVRLVVAYPAGASLDNLSRSFGEQLRQIIGETVVVENKAGANGTIGAQAVAQAAPNGKTLLIAGDTLVTVNPVLYTKSNFDIDSLEPLGMLAFQSSVLAVRADNRARTLPEFIANAKQKEITYSSAGLGSSGHLMMANLIAASGIKAIHVPYKGGAPAVMAIMSGEVDAAFLAVGNLLPYIQQGKLRALGVSSPARLSALPDTPTMVEAGFKDFAIRNGNLLLAPKGLPPEIKRELAGQLAQARDSKAFQENLASLGMEAATLGPAETAQWLKTEGRRWEQVIKQNGIKVE
ncbi:Tripartite tricarboxylate transporter family receptor [Pigmentiphaga humi]|uniref:Tripartite tricarboxylate transporter family receptor n=1 Tax=Pigmentiphaga humi TaxID=2478468 RepID=A0A3P4AVC7_9BURK|nr:tripartite tricarboxylate transporter substrate binding protein [Pigmentiphaga humi]VCU67973.1 Tripartite tricarboxylate transporter family receptor [Pigmentiphaga humi]